jgi:hypothetical protein
VQLLDLQHAAALIAMAFARLGERFQSLGFPTRDEPVHPDRALVAAARDAVEAAVADDAFLADCIGLELDLIASGRPRRGLTPFAVLPELGIRFAFGYWAPGQTAGAHEHTAWTITALCRNTLEVLTYDRAATHRSGRLVPKNRFAAQAGRTGFIFEPSIHEPRNVSGDWSFTLHVTSPRDGEPAADGLGPLPTQPHRRQRLAGQAAYAPVIGARMRNRCVHQLARIVAEMPVPVPARPALLSRCRALGAARTRRKVGQWLEDQEQTTAPLRFRWTAPGLPMESREEDGMLVLQALTPQGMRDEFAVDAIAAPALAFLLAEDSFAAADLPGGLSNAEALAMIETLEETGLLSRVAADD